MNLSLQEGGIAEYKRILPTFCTKGKQITREQ